MTERKSVKLTYAEQRVAYLTEYLAKLKKFASFGVTERAGHTLGVYLDTEQPELNRVCRQVDVAPPADKYSSSTSVLIALREWQRVDELAKERVATLRSYLAEVRRLETIEILVEHANQMNRDSAGLLEEPRRVLAEEAPKMTELRDQLGEAQHEIERALNEVGRSLNDYWLARGARGIVDFVAGEITAAVGAYREWPTTRVGRKPRGANAPAAISHPPALVFNINNSNTVQVTVTQVLEHLIQAVDAAAPAEKKSGWRDTRNEIAASAAGAGVKAAFEKLFTPGG
jgi:hypothetical protein